MLCKIKLHWHILPLQIVRCQPNLTTAIFSREWDFALVNMDLKEVYDTIDRHGMWQMLRVYGV